MTAFRQQIQVFIDANLSPAARSNILADAARTGLAGLISSGRAPPTYQTFVDGKRDDDDESHVRGTGGGTILYQFSAQAEAAAFALGYLRARAPGRSGTFRNSFYLGINGRFVPAAQFDPAQVPSGAEITIGNTRPQSRKIDVQMDGERVLHFSVPAGLFDDCAAAVRRQFGGLVIARRISTLRFPGQYNIARGKNAGSAVDSPAVVLTAVQ